MSYRTPSDKAPAATARDALGYAIHAAICPRLGRPCSGAHALPDADAILAALPDGWTLATAEAPGRVAALEAALVALPVGRYTASRYDTDDLHRLHVWNAEQSWDLDVPRIAAPAPTPSEPVARFTGQDEWPCVCGHVKRRHHFGDTPALDGSFGAWCQADPMHCVRFTPGARDE